MKKVLVTLLAVFYLGVSSGATVHFHYCMGQLINVGLGHEKGSECSNCGMKKTAAKKCCQDKHQQFKVEKAQNTAENNLLLKQFTVSAPLLQFTELPVQSDLAVTSEHPLSHAPPGAGKTPVFIRNCTFRI